MDLSILTKDFSIIEKDNFFSEYTKGINAFKVFENDTTEYFSNRNKGVEFIFNNGKLTSIHCFGKGNKEYQVFEGVLPYDIKLSDNISEVYNKFGMFEIKKGGGEILPILGKINNWAIFKIGEYYFRFEFNDDSSITLITVMKNLV